jgi:hypothetical protein
MGETHPYTSLRRADHLLGSSRRLRKHRRASLPAYGSPSTEFVGTIEPYKNRCQTESGGDPTGLTLQDRLRGIIFFSPSIIHLRKRNSNVTLNALRTESSKIRRPTWRLSFEILKRLRN